MAAGPATTLLPVAVGVPTYNRRSSVLWLNDSVAPAVVDGEVSLLLAADDDVVDRGGLPGLRTWLGLTGPDLARTFHAQIDVAGMGPEYPTAPLRPKEFRDAASRWPLDRAALRQRAAGWARRVGGR